MPKKVCIVKAMFFPVVVYGYESWTIKKAECWRIDAFKLWCWRRLLRVPWTARRSNQSTLKDINPEYSLEGLMLKLKCQYFGHLLQRANSFEKTLMLGKIEGRRRMIEDKMIGWHHWLKGHELEQAPGDGEGQGSLVCCCPWGCKQSDMTEWLETNKGYSSPRTANFQMFKLDLEKVEEPEIKLPASTGSQKKRGIPEKHRLLFYWLHESFWWIDYNKLWKILGLPDHLICLLRNLYASQGTTVMTWNNWVIQNWEKKGWEFLIHSEVKYSVFAQSCPTLRDPKDYSLPGSSIHGIFQTRVLE